MLGCSLHDGDRIEIDPGLFAVARARNEVHSACIRVCGVSGCVNPDHLVGASHPWELSNRADPEARDIADRHYNRQKVGAKQFVPPGRAIVLLRRGGWFADSGSAFWITSWPFAEHVKHRWAGAMVCTAFRNEGAGDLSSDLVLGAVAASAAIFGVPELGMVTFIDRSQVRSKKHYGMCYRHAGFEDVGFTEGGLVALHLSAARFPEPAPPLAPRPGIGSKYANLCRPR